MSSPGLESDLSRTSWKTGKTGPNDPSGVEATHAKRPSKVKQVVLAILAIVLVVGALAGVKAAQIGSMIKAGESFKMPPETVTSAPVVSSTWEQRLNAVGSVVAVRAVTIAAELPGQVKSIHFESGASAKTGQVLVRLDTTMEEAQLASAKAEADLAKISLERAEGLRKANANTIADLDQATARAAQANAAVANIEATIAKKTIRAPFDGRLGMRTVELGQIVSPGAPLVTLQSFDPIYAEFWLPQQALAQVKLGQVVRVSTDTFPGESWEGKISTINPEVEISTRNVRIQATFANSDGRVRPGMFVNVEVVAPQTTETLVIPATAVLYAPYGDSVFTVEEKKDEAGKATLTARQKFVRLGERRGDLVAVVSGLAAGETVVSSGAFKLRNGSEVVVNNALAPGAELAPKPEDK